MTGQTRLATTRPEHIVLRRYRITPHHFERIIENLSGTSLSIHNELEKFADSISSTLEDIYTRGFDDGYAAALLDHERGHPHGA